MTRKRKLLCHVCAVYLIFYTGLSVVYFYDLMVLGGHYVLPTIKQDLAFWFTSFLLARFL